MQRLRCLPALEPRLAWYVLNSRIGRQQLVFNSNTTTGLANLNGTILGDVLLPIPPSTNKLAIVRYLDHETVRIDAAIGHARREIELLREYRIRLIADVVTGKLDVREAAATLPEIDLAHLEDIIEIDDVAADELAPELEEVAT